MTKIMMADLRLKGTAACLLRDELQKAWFDGRIKRHTICDRMLKLQEWPDFLEGQILQMVKYRGLERCKCPIETQMADAVYARILRRILDDKNSSYSVQDTINHINKNTIQ